MKWRWIDHKATQTPRCIRDMTIAIISLAFSVLFIWYSRTRATASGGLGTVLPCRRRASARHFPSTWHDAST